MRSLFATRRRRLLARAALYGAALFVGLPFAASQMAEFRAGFDADEVSAVEAARRVRGALFLIVDEDDERMPEAVVRRVFDAHHGPKRIWTAPGAPHSGAANAPGYWDAVVGFLEANGL